MKDLYTELGVSKTASADEIKKAYRELAFKYHPDRNPGDAAAEERFKNINAAYSVLGDEAKRSQYDMYGSAETSSYSDPFANQRYGNAARFDSADAFWEWFANVQNSSEQNSEGNTYWHSFSWGRQEPPQNLSKSDALVMLIKRLLMISLGIIFLPYSFGFLWIIPIGLFVPVLCIAAIVNGIKGALTAVKCLFSQNKE